MDSDHFRGDTDPNGLYRILELTKRVALHAGRFLMNGIFGDHSIATGEINTQSQDLYLQAELLTEQENGEALPEERRWMSLENVTFTRNENTVQIPSLKVSDEVLMMPVLTGDVEPKVVLVERDAPALGKDITMMAALSKADISSNGGKSIDSRVVAFQALQKLNIQGAEKVMPKLVNYTAPWKYSSATARGFMAAYRMTEQEFTATTLIRDEKTSGFKAYTEAEFLEAIAIGEVRDMQAIALALKTFGQLRGEYLPDSNFTLPANLDKLLVPLNATAIDLNESVKSRWFTFTKTASGEPLLVKVSDQSQALCVEYGTETNEPIGIYFNTEPVPGHKVVALGNPSGGVDVKKHFTPASTAIAEASQEIGVTGVEPKLLVAGLPLGMYWDFGSHAYVVRVAGVADAYGSGVDVDADESKAERGTRVRLSMDEVRACLANDVFPDATTQASILIFLARQRAAKR